MPLDLNCPKCSYVFPVTEARGAVGVECPGCAAELAAEFRKRDAVEPGQHCYELLISPSRPEGAVSSFVPSTRKLRLEDEEETATGNGSMTIVIVSSIGALIVALAGLGATGYLLFSNLDTSDSTISQVSSGTGGGHKPVNPVGGLIPGGGHPPAGGIPGTPPFNPSQPKVDTFDLRPVAGIAQPISPPPIDLSSPVTINLPGRAEAMAVGGNGRYLVFHCPANGQLLVFDVNKGEIIARENADQGQVRLAAGQNRLVMLVNNILRVYDLPSLKKRYDTSPPKLFHGANSIAMGSATNGPLIACDPFGEVVLINIGDNGAEPVEGSQYKIGGDLTVPIRAAANGKLFVRGGFNSSNKTVIATEGGRRWQTITAEAPNAYPAADGRHILGFGIITNERGNPIGSRAGGKGNGIWYVPAVSGNYFLRLAEVKEGDGPLAKQTVSLSVHKDYRNAEGEKAVTLGVLPEMSDIVRFFFGDTLPLHEHLFLIPEAKLLVILPASKDKLVLHKVELR